MVLTYCLKNRTIDADILQRECGLCSFLGIGDFEKYLLKLKL